MQINAWFLSTVYCRFGSSRISNIPFLNHQLHGPTTFSISFQIGYDIACHNTIDFVLTSQTSNDSTLTIGAAPGMGDWKLFKKENILVFLGKRVSC